MEERISLLVRPGQLTLIIGPMFSRKTTHLRELCCEEVPVIFYPKEYGLMKENLTTHDADIIQEAVMLEKPRMMLKWFEKFRHFYIDELPLWSSPGQLYQTICHLLDHGKVVVGSGFDYDVAGTQVPVVAALQKIASKVIHLRPKCTECGRPATMTEKLAGDFDRAIQSGGKYAPRCAEHFTPIWMKE